MADAFFKFGTDIDQTRQQIRAGLAGIASDLGKQRGGNVTMFEPIVQAANEAARKATAELGRIGNRLAAGTANQTIGVGGPSGAGPQLAREFENLKTTQLAKLKADLKTLGEAQGLSPQEIHRLSDSGSALVRRQLEEFYQTIARTLAADTRSASKAAFLRGDVRVATDPSVRARDALLQKVLGRDANQTLVADAHRGDTSTGADAARRRLKLIQDEAYGIQRTALQQDRLKTAIDARDIKAQEAIEKEITRDKEQRRREEASRLKSAERIARAEVRASTERETAARVLGDPSTLPAPRGRFVVGSTQEVFKKQGAGLVLEPNKVEEADARAAVAAKQIADVEAKRLLDLKTKSKEEAEALSAKLKADRESARLAKVAKDEQAKIARELEQQAREDARPVGLGQNFLSGFESRGFSSGLKSGGTSNGLEGLAATAGISVKYAAIGASIGIAAKAVGELKSQTFDFIDSQTAFNAALNNGQKATQSYINTLQNFSAEAGANVGAALDTATRGAAAFSTAAGPDVAAGAKVAEAANQLKVITGDELAATTDNLIAISQAYKLGADNLSQVNDAIVNARRNTGATPADISNGLASFAVAATEAGFNLNEAANVIGLTIAKVAESGDAAGTRLTKVFAIIGGSSGQAAIRNLNQTLSPDKQVDTTAPIKLQLEQLAVAYQHAGSAQQAQLRSALGGTANVRELLVLLNNQTQLQNANTRSAQGAGNAAAEYRRRLRDITGVVREISGDLKALAVNITSTGAFDLILPGLRGVQLILHDVNLLLQEFNAILPRGVRSGTFAVLDLVLAYKALAKVSTLTGGGIGASLLKLPFVNRVPASFGLNTGNITTTSKDALKASGGIVTPSIARLQAAENKLADSVGAIEATNREVASATKAANDRVVAAQAEYTAALNAGTGEASAALAEVRAAEVALAGEIEAGAALIAEANSANQLAAAEAARASAPAKASAAAVSSVLQPNRALTRARQVEIDAENKASVAVAQARAQEVAARTKGDVELAAATKNRKEVEAREAAVVEQAAVERRAAEAENLAAIEAAAAGNLGRGRVATFLRGSGEEGESAGLLRLGPLLAIGIAAAVGLSLRDSFDKITKAVDKATDLTSNRVTSSNSQELANTATELRGAAKAARASSAGIVGSSLNFLRGDATGKASDRAIAEANSLEAVAKKLEAIEAKQRLSQHPFGAIDLSTPETIADSFKALGDSGRNATTQFDALIQALNHASASAKGFSTSLTGFDASRFTTALGTNVANAIRAQTSDLEAETQGHPLDSPFQLSPSPRRKAIRILDKADFSAITDQVGQVASDFAAENGGKIPRDPKQLKKLKDAIAQIVRANIPNFDQLSSDIQAMIINQATGAVVGTAKGINPDFLKPGVDPKVAAAAAKASNAAAQRKVDDARKAVTAAGKSGDILGLLTAEKALDKAITDQAKTKAANAATLADAQAVSLADRLEAARELVSTAPAKAHESATQFSLNPTKGDTRSGSLVEAQDLVDNLTTARDALVKAGAKGPEGKAELEQLQSDLDDARLALQQATSSEASSLTAFAVSVASPFDKSGRLARQIQGVQQELDATTDPGQRRALQTQLNDLQNQAADQTLADATSFNDLKASRQGGATAPALAAAKNAQLKLARIRSTGVTHGEELNKAVEDVEKANQALALARIDDASALRASKIDPRNLVAVAREALRKDTARAAQIKHDRPGDKLASAAAAEQVAADKQTLADRLRETANAKLQAGVFTGDALGGAKVNLAIAQSALKATLKNTKEYYDALKNVQDAQHALADAEAAAAKTAASLHIDLTNPLAVATLNLQDAKSALARDVKAKAPKSVLDTDRVNVINAQATADSTAFSQQLSDVQTAEQLGQISHAAYIAYLQSEHNRLHAKLATLKVTDQEYRQFKEESDTIDQALQAAANELSGQFNLGDIKLPTVFEVRRSVASAVGSVTAVINAAQDQASTSLGSGSSGVIALGAQIGALSTTSAVSQLQALQRAIDNIFTTMPTTAGQVAGPAVGTTTINNNTVTISGADFAAVVNYLNTILGPSSQTLSSSGRKL